MEELSILQQIEVTSRLFAEGKYIDARESLEQIYLISPNHPIINAYLGLVCEAQGEKEKAQEYYRIAIDKYLILSKDDPLALLNLCILYDATGQTDKLQETIVKPLFINHLDYDGWFNWGFLYLKLNRFEDALFCFKNAKDFIFDSIACMEKIGFCLAGLKRYDEAIQTLLDAQSLAESREDLKKDIPEIWHALGHFFSWKYVQFEDPEDRLQAVKYISMAAEKDVTYITCLGIVHTEAKRYSEALDVFEKALLEQELRSNDYLFMETYFYRSEAYLGLERYEEALEELQQFEDFCIRVDNTIGKTYSQFCRLRIWLKRHSFEGLSLLDLDRFLDDLEAIRLSPYIDHAVTSEYEKIKHLLLGLREIRAHLEDATINRASLKSGINHLRMIQEKKNLVDVLVLSDTSFTLGLSNFGEFCHFIPFDQNNKIRPGDFDFWVLLYNKSIPLSHAVLVGEFLNSSKSIFAYASNEISSILRENFNGNATIIFENMEDLFSTLELALLFDQTRNFLRNRIIPLGGALGTGSSIPTLVAPKGLLPWRESFFTWTSVKVN